MEVDMMETEAEAEADPEKEKINAEDGLNLCILGSFQPFGLTLMHTAENLAPSPSNSTNGRGNYAYSLLDPELLLPSTRGRIPCLDYDEEIFIHDNTVIWSAGGQVRKRFSAPSTVIQAVWSYFNSIHEPLLCVLHSACLSTFTPSGVMNTVPLPHVMVSMWPLPHGLLLEKGSSCATLCAHSMNTRVSKNEASSLHMPSARSGSSSSAMPAEVSHFVLQHPLEEPEVLLQREAGFFGTLDANEKIIWSHNDLFYVASYHIGTMQHSLWKINFINGLRETTSFTVKREECKSFGTGHCIYMERIWQDMGHQKRADQVLLATDDDGTPILCFLLRPLQKLSALRLFIDEKMVSNTIMAWSIPAIAAASVVATRPWSRWSMKQFDLVILAPDGSLHLHRGQHWLCRLQFPWCLLRSASPSSFLHDGLQREEIIDLLDAVQGRLNVITCSGQAIRCAVCVQPSCALLMSCCMVLHDGLHRSLYDRFMISLLGNRARRSSMRIINIEVGGKPDLEWASFVDVLMGWCHDGARKPSSSSSAWEFLLESDLHQRNKGQYVSVTSFACASSKGSLQGGKLVQGTSELLTMLNEVLMTLHVAYEDRKVDTLRWSELYPLAFVLANIAARLCEWNFVDHYARDFPDLFKLLEGCTLSNIKQSLRVPFDIFHWLEGLMHANNKRYKLPAMYLIEGSVCVDFSRKVVAFYELLGCKEEVVDRLPSGLHLHIASGSSQNSEERLVLAMVGEGFSLSDLDLLPAGVSLPLRHALNSCRERPPFDWPGAAFVLVGREDLAFMRSQMHNERAVTTSPYMQHLRPVHVISSTDDLHESSTDTSTSDHAAGDGMEHMFSATMQLRFGRDLRLNEVRRLLMSSRPVPVRMANPPDVSDPDIVAQQQVQLWQLAQRTTSLPFGRGAFTLATMHTISTEVLPVPKLVLAGRLPSQHDAIVNLDASTGNISDLTSWPEFHNGVAAGLRLAPYQDKITRTWIVYNKPEEPSYAHAGLLLSLGLHGHLRALAATDVYRYLSQEHEATTVGILLGMSAAHRGTMDPAISKILYLHIPTRHPPSFPELELPTLMQSAALMAVGLLYQGSAHRLTTEILLGEIGRKPGSDNALEREGYALAAGLALGLVTLGKGKGAWGLSDLMIEERLLHYMSGGTEPGEGNMQRFDGTSGNVFASSSKSFEDLYQNNGQVMEGSMVNLDVTAPGATLALGLMFLKTNSEDVAARLAIPDTHFALEYVRPDFILLRVIARNLVMWDSIEATEEWVQSQVPLIVKECLPGESEDSKRASDSSPDIDMEALAQAHVNILAGSCLSIGLRYAGTFSEHAQQLLYHYALYFLKEKRSAASLAGGAGAHKATYVDRGTLETCLDVAILSLSLVMAGSGHLGTFKLLRYLRKRNDFDGTITYGNHMAVNMAIGFLFLGGGTMTFSTNNNSIAALLIALYPRFATAPNDHRCHLQAFRHFYVIATERRCIQTIDVDTGLPVYVPLEITIQETHYYSETTTCLVSPCILPERCLLKRIRVCGPRYWPQEISLCPSDQSWWRPIEDENPFKNGLIFVKRKVGALSYVDDPTGCRSLLSRTLEKNITGVIQTQVQDGDSKVDKIVGTFSADPSLLAFAQIFCTACDSKPSNKFEDFCVQALLESVTSDKPALLQAYLSLYNIVEGLMDITKGSTGTLSCQLSRTLSLSSLKVALAYSDMVGRKLLHLQGAPLLQETFLIALASRVDDILQSKLPVQGPNICGANYLINDLREYLNIFQSERCQRFNVQNFSLFACYLQWYDIPPPGLLGRLSNVYSLLDALHFHHLPSLANSLPILALMLPCTTTRALVQIHQCMQC